MGEGDQARCGAGVRAEGQGDEGRSGEYVQGKDSAGIFPFNPNVCEHGLFDVGLRCLYVSVRQRDWPS